MIPRSNHKPQIDEVRTIQLPKDTKGVIRSRKYHIVIVLSGLRLFTASDHPLVSYCHCIVRTSSIYGF
jgi:hypothetical protein